MEKLSRDLVALVAAADPENGGTGRICFADLKALAARAAELIRPRDVMEIEIQAIEDNLLRRSAANNGGECHSP